MANVYVYLNLNTAIIAPLTWDIHGKQLLSLILLVSQSTVVLCIIEMDEVMAHHVCTFETSDLHYHFQFFDNAG